VPDSEPLSAHPTGGSACVFVRSTVSPASCSAVAKLPFLCSIM
jgi:hypothetical protein